MKDRAMKNRKMENKEKNDTPDLKQFLRHTT